VERKAIALANKQHARTASQRINAMANSSREWIRWSAQTNIYPIEVASQQGCLFFAHCLN